METSDKRGRVYKCLEEGCDMWGEKKRVKEHIYKVHIPLCQSPFYCTLCLFRCEKEVDIKKHVKNYKPHVDRIGGRGDDGGNEERFTRESVKPYKLTLGKDWEKVDRVESQEMWKARREKKDKVVEVEEYVPEGPEPDRVYVPSKKRKTVEEGEVAALDLSTKRVREEVTRESCEAEERAGVKELDVLIDRWVNGEQKEEKMWEEMKKIKAEVEKNGRMLKEVLTMLRKKELRDEE